MRRAVAAAAVGLAVVCTVWDAREARACGGCFTAPPPPPKPMGPPPESVDSVITSERMIFSISKDKTTLFDEITYSGNPASFAWVLPIRGEVEVGLSADALFAAIDSMTSVKVAAPPENCPAAPTCYNNYGYGYGGGFLCGCGGGAGSDEGGEGGWSPGADGSEDAAPPVEVLANDQVGPYEAVQLKSSDGSALTRWLGAHGYEIKRDDAPAIAHYVAQGMDFLALKLVPGHGVKTMQPVRVTTKGAFPVLPLRMVGVGTGPVTGITIWIVAEGRWEPQNARSFQIEPNEVVWDWVKESSNYETVRTAAEKAFDGAGWQIESSLDLNKESVTNKLDRVLAASGTVGGYGPPISAVMGGTDAGTGAAPDAGAGPDSGTDAGTEGGVPDAAMDATPDGAARKETGGDAPGEGGATEAAPAEASTPEATTSDGQLGEGGALPEGGADDGPGAVSTDAGAIESNAPDAGPTPSEEEEDLALLFAGISGQNARFTRLRGDIAHAALTKDLVIQASSDPSEVSNLVDVTREANQPLCPVYDSSCSPVGKLPRAEAKRRNEAAQAEANAQSGGSGQGGSCSATRTPRATHATLALGTMFLALTALRARRRGSRKK